MKELFANIYYNKTVLVTGHTGFKGSWLCFWLSKMGARVIGFALPPATTPNHHELCRPDMVSVVGDIRNQEQLEAVFSLYKPDIVFHLAAQSLVRKSYDEPVTTYETNVIGTLQIFEACRRHSVGSIVSIASDKAYQNNEWVWGYRENDPLGGYDPYSSSKACAEILADSYRNSYFHVEKYGVEHNTLLATCRAGNVIGGGDWASDRLMVDIMLAVSEGKVAEIRSPHATRPWQHVLEPLSGYLLLGQKLLERRKGFSKAWNFGPDDNGNITVEQVVKKVKTYWPLTEYVIKSIGTVKHEAGFLALDSAMARLELGWKAVWSTEKTFEHTVGWYKCFYELNQINTETDLERFIHDAYMKGSQWAKEVC